MNWNDDATFLLGIFAFFLVLMIVSVWIISYERIKYHLNPKEFVGKKISLLFDAIKGRKVYLAYRFFNILTVIFKIKKPDIFKVFFSISDEFILNRGVPVEANWELVIEGFLKILSQYQKSPSTDRAISYDVICKMIKELEQMLDDLIPETLPLKCLECATDIADYEECCSKCGWTWIK